MSVSKCADCSYEFPNVNDEFACPECGCNRKNKSVVLHETIHITEKVSITKEGNRTIKNYYALVLAIIITITAIYTLSLDSVFSVNIVINVFLGMLDIMAFYLAFTKSHFKETSS